MGRGLVFSAASAGFSSITGIRVAPGGHEARRSAPRKETPLLTFVWRDSRCQCHSGFRTDTRFHS